MSDRRSIAVVNAQFKHATKEPNPFLKFYMDEGNIKTWYILIHDISGDEDEFVGGEYILKLTLTDKFPFEAPKPSMLTPQGVFKPDGNICISIGHFHNQNARDVAGVSGFAMNVVSALIGWRQIDNAADSIGHAITTVEHKKKMAAESVEYNRSNHAELISKINESYDNYSKTWK